MHIPFKAYATPDTLANGDMIAIYAGNTFPSHVATFDHLVTSGNLPTVTIVTTDGERYDVPADTDRIWVAAWAPLADPPPATPTRPTYSRAQRHAARFAPMGVR